MSWREKAACVGADPEIFAPVELHSDTAMERIDSAALRYCSTCSVVLECGSFADESRHTGIWGGVYRRYQQGRYVWRIALTGAPEPQLTDRRSGVRGAAWAS